MRRDSGSVYVANAWKGLLLITQPTTAESTPISVRPPSDSPTLGPVLPLGVLTQREQELRARLEDACVAFHWVGPDGTILWANRAELEMLGYSRDEYIGHPITKFHADQPVIDQMLGRLFTGETLRDYPGALAMPRWIDSQCAH